MICAEIVSTFTVIADNADRRARLAPLVIGQPPAVIESKDLSNLNATTKRAQTSHQRFKDQNPALFNTEEVIHNRPGAEALDLPRKQVVLWLAAWCSQPSRSAHAPSRSIHSGLRRWRVVRSSSTKPRTHALVPSVWSFATLDSTQKEALFADSHSDQEEIKIVVLKSKPRGSALIERG